MCNETTYAFQNFNRWSLEMDKWFHPKVDWACDYLSMVILKLNLVDNRGPGVYALGLYMRV